MRFISFYTTIRREIERFLRIPIQTIVSPLISALLYIFIFGYILGDRIQFFENISYVDFVLPGIIMMNIIGAAFGQASASLYFHRFSRSIDEILTSPVSYLEMILGYVLGGLVRSIIVGIGVFVIALFFTRTSLDHIGLFFFYLIIVSLMFSFIGLLVGLWAEKFEHLSVLQTFVITPLIYVGGVFNSIEMFPEPIQFFTRLNPFFYMVDGLRYSMISYTESHLMGGGIFLVSLTLILFIIVFLLFRRGYKIRV